MSARPGSPTPDSPCPRRSISVWTVPGCRCDRPRSRDGRGNSPMGRPERGKPNSVRSGAPRDGTRRGGLSAIRTRSPTLRPSRAPPHGIRPPSFRSLPNESSAKASVAVSGKRPRQVVLGDGAKWIWNLAGELFPEAVQIVDRFPRQRATPYALQESVCGPPVRAGVGSKTLWGTRCRSDRDPAFGPRHRDLPPRGGQSGLDLFPRESTSHALRSVRGPGTVHLHRRSGSRMQERHRVTTQTVRDALERAGSQFHYGSALHSTQRAL